MMRHIMASRGGLAAESATLKLRHSWDDLVCDLEVMC